MILVPANKVEKIKYFSTLLGLIFIEITRGPLSPLVLAIPAIWVVVVLRSPIHANEPSEYNGMLYRTSNRVLNNGIKVIILICMDGTSQYHHHRDLSYMIVHHALPIISFYF